MRWTRAAFSGAALLALAGCASAPPLVHVCPALVSYSPAAQREVSAEMRAAPADALWPRWIRDYGATRQAIRSCGG